MPGTSGQDSHTLAQIPESIYPDRSTGLTIFGIIEIIFGALSLLMIPIMLLGAAMSRKVAGGSVPAGSYVINICSFSFLAFGLITLGAGSIGARRWARALNLICAWAGLLFGILVIVLVTAVLPSTFMASLRQAEANQPGAGQMSTGVAAVILTFVIVFISVLLIIVPLAFLLFFKRKDVEETCKRRDPVERWTDRTPLPVLAMSMLLGFGGVYTALIAITTPMMPFFGRYVTGWPASIVLIAWSALDIFLAIALYRLRPVGWWVAVLALLIRAVSALLTFSLDDVLHAYSKMGWSQGRIEMMRSNPAIHAGIWINVVLMGVTLAYLLWIRRYFKTHAEEPATEMTSSTGIAS